MTYIIRYISPSTHYSDDEVSFTSILYICLSCILIHGNNPIIYVTVCHKNFSNHLHNPTLAVSDLLQILYIIRTNLLDNHLWITVKCLDILTLVWQPIKHLIPKSVFVVRILSVSIKLCCKSITYVWHLIFDTNCMPIIQDLHHQCHSGWRWWWWWITPTTTTHTTFMWQ